MAANQGRTVRHRISVLMAGVYRLHWTYDTKIAGSRLRWPRTMSRDTDEAGALRFSKKWGCPMPKQTGES